MLMVSAFGVSEKQSPQHNSSRWTEGRFPHSRPSSSMGGKEAGFILFCAAQIWQKIGESVLGQSVAFLPGFLFILDRVMDAAGGEARLVVRAPRILCASRCLGRGGVSWQATGGRSSEAEALECL